MEETTNSITGKDFKVSTAEIGKILTAQRKRNGRSQGDIAKELGYVNVNFISMLESGKSKIPMNKIDELVEAYGFSPEFSLVIIRAVYPNFFDTIYRFAKKAPRLFKETISNPNEKVSQIYGQTKDALRLR